MLLIIAGCERKPPAPPTPNPGGGGNESISGNERLGWDQQADGTDELATFRYAIFVDGNRSEIGASRAAPLRRRPALPAADGCRPCRPALTHCSWRRSSSRNGEPLESERSATLNVVVSAPTASEHLTPGAGAIIGTSERPRFPRCIDLVNGLEQPTDMAIAPDGRVFVSEASGRISIVAAAGAAHRAGGRSRRHASPSSRSHSIRNSRATVSST